MRINGVGSFPLNVAKAYGAKAPAAPKTVAPAAAARSADPIKNLVAGRVSQPVSFDSIPTATAARPVDPIQPLQMYTRAADKIEAAVAVQIGRMIDVEA